MKLSTKPQRLDKATVYYEHQDYIELIIDPLAAGVEVVAPLGHQDAVKIKGLSGVDAVTGLRMRVPLAMLRATLKRASGSKPAQLCAEKVQE